MTMTNERGLSLGLRNLHAPRGARLGSVRVSKSGSSVNHRDRPTQVGGSGAEWDRIVSRAENHEFWWWGAGSQKDAARAEDPGFGAWIECVHHLEGGKFDGF